MISPRPLTSARSRSSSRAMRQPARAPRRPARAARRQPHRARCASPSCASGSGRERLREAHRRGARLLRAAHARLPGGAAATACARRATCSRRPRATSSCACAPTVDGRAPAARLRRQRRRSTTGNLNCPLAVTRSACLFAVRVLTDPDIPPSAGAYRPVEVRAPRRAACSTRGAGRGGRGGQRRDLLARRRPRAERVRPRAGPGHDEQPHARRRALLLLRDARRRPGRVRGRGRPERRARRDEQHAEHADRGARARIPAARASSTRCAAARAAPGATAAATASCASWRRCAR